MLVVTGAWIGSRDGYQRVFLLGLGGFTVMSLARGLAPSAAFLVAARIAQGAAAAIMTPQVLSLIQIRFCMSLPEPEPAGRPPLVCWRPRVSGFGWSPAAAAGRRTR